MRLAIFGAAMLFLGLSLSPGPTVAQKQEELAKLCARFEKEAAPTLKLHTTFVEKGDPRSNMRYGQRDEAVVISLRAMRDVLCAQ